MTDNKIAPSENNTEPEPDDSRASALPPIAGTLAAVEGADLVAARKQRKSGRRLASLATLASKPGIARVEMKPDGTVVVITGTPDSTAPENPWSLDEFRTKETKE